MNIEGSSWEEMLSEQVKRTLIETARAKALQTDLSQTNLEKATAQSELLASEAKVVELTLRAEQAEDLLGAKKKVMAELRELRADLERKLVALAESLEAEKTTASLAYFEERSRELVSMGAGIMKEGRDVG